jgi:hypothetical protein
MQEMGTETVEWICNAVFCGGFYKTWISDFAKIYPNYICRRKKYLGFPPGT